MNDKILLSHGSGGRLTHDLIKDLFAKYFNNEYLSSLSDSAVINLNSKRIAYSTDSYVVNPLKFPGGNIGKLAICGTVNDLAVAGARPLYLSCGFIIEEGLDITLLEEIVASMSETAKKAGVLIVTGDTKVVDKGAADGLFINTAGIGEINEDVKLGYDKIQSGDKVIINGNIGDHGMAVMAAREGLGLSGNLKSDCAALNDLISNVLQSEVGSRRPNIKFMRDPTRGGFATTLCELSETTGFDIEINEASLPISEEVKGISEVLGIDPLFSANEGKVLIIVSSETADATLNKLQNHPLGKEAAIIGVIKDSKNSRVTLKTEIGTSRHISMLTGAQLPRIC